MRKFLFDTRGTNDRFSTCISVFKPHGMFYFNNNKSSEVTADLSSPGCGKKSTFSLRRAPLRLQQHAD